jgi:4,5-dihydroxyphthalate decarboxylase
MANIAPLIFGEKRRPMSRNVHLTVATTDYDHVRDPRLGDIRAEGIDLTWRTMDIHDIFTRFTLNRDRQVSELSFARFISDATHAASPA